MENEAVDVVRAQMVERTCQRLPDLFGEWRARIIRQTMVLSTRVGEFGLNKEILTRDEPFVDRARDSGPGRGLVIVLPLIGGIDAAESALDG